eukprot:364845-Chlamydomonas_euryale.AAC.4
MRTCPRKHRRYCDRTPLPHADGGGCRKQLRGAHPLAQACKAQQHHIATRDGVHAPRNEAHLQADPETGGTGSMGRC